MSDTGADPASRGAEAARARTAAPAVAPAPSPAPSPAPRAPTHDLPCFRCGYNIRGLMLDANCPECGLPVWHSRTLARLDRVTPTAVPRLAAGLAFAAAEYAVLFAAGVMALLAQYAGRTAEPFACLAFAAAAAACVGGGVLTATKVSPKTPDRDLRVTTRLLTTLLAVQYALLALVSLVLTAGRSGDPLTESARDAYTLLAFAFPVTAAARTCIQFSLLALIVRRIPGGRLDRPSVAAAVVVPLAWLALGFGANLGQFFTTVPVWLPPLLAGCVLLAFGGAVVYLVCVRDALPRESNSD